MSVPDYQSLMEPVLRIVSHEGQQTMRDLTNLVADDLGLSDEDRAGTMASGYSWISNRAQWAVTYLVKAGAIVRPKRGQVDITDRGRQLLAAGGPIRNAQLRQFPEFLEFVDSSKSAAVHPEVVTATESAESPTDLLARAEAASRAVLAGDLLDRVRTIAPVEFERLVLALLRAMGYGAAGSLVHSGQSGDGGIDGIISQDPLGLDRIYLQAKRYAAANVVHSPAIREFVGALMGAQGDRGVFITTSKFSSGAKVAADRVNARIELIDGERLVGLMIAFGVGVQAESTVTLYRMDEDFFDGL